MNTVEDIARAVAAELRRRAHRGGHIDVPVGVSNRHIHLSRADLETLFGAGHDLRVRNHLGQPGQYAALETVIVAGRTGAIERVRVLGPVRKQTQVELNVSDCFRIGIEPVVRESGDLEGTPGAVIVGPAGAVALTGGVIVARRHVHMALSQAACLGLKDGQAVSIAVGSGSRRLLFFDVVLRARNDFALEYHVDTDEANAAGLRTGDTVRLVFAGVRDDWMK
ncbi:MAG: phosphate propanoyltransferase [Ignavibacteriales bacterium]